MGGRLRSGGDSLGGQQDDPSDSAGLRDVEDALRAQQVRAGAELEEQRVGALEGGPEALRVGQVGLAVPDTRRVRRAGTPRDTAVTCSPAAASACTSASSDVPGGSRYYDHETSPID